MSARAPRPTRDAEHARTQREQQSTGSTGVPAMLRPLRSRAAGVAGNQQRQHVMLTPSRISAAVRPGGTRIREGASRCWPSQPAGGHGIIRIAAMTRRLCRPVSTDSRSEPEEPRLTRAERRRLQRQQNSRQGDRAASSAEVGLGVSQSSTREAAIRLWAQEPVLFESNRRGLVRILSSLSVIQVSMRCRCIVTLEA